MYSSNLDVQTPVFYPNTGANTYTVLDILELLPAEDYVNYTTLMQTGAII